jgi:hypothetical protein
MMNPDSEPSKKRPCPGPPPSTSIDTTPSDTHSAVPGLADTTRPAGQPATHVNPHFVKSGDMTRIREEVKEARNKDKLCMLCSTKRRPVSHPHTSTQELREFALKYRTTGSFSCIICKKEEKAELPSNMTRRVVLSDSTLFNIWEMDDLKVNEHFELEAIVGGRVHDMTRALDKLYLDKPNRLEIITVVSINNIGDGQSANSIMKDFSYMKQLVAEHSELYGHSPPSYISISTCMLPPKYTSFQVPNQVPQVAMWTPPPNFTNYATTIESLNNRIIEVNTQAKISYIGLHLIGMKFFKSGNKQHKFDTSPGAKRIWRENEVFKKLHFTQEQKLKIVGLIMKRFEDNSKTVMSD